MSRVGVHNFFPPAKAHAAPHHLFATRPLPSAPVGLHQFGAALPAFRPESRSDLARLLKLIVPVIGKAGAHPEAVEKAAHPHLAAHIHARLAHVNPHIAVLVVFLFPLLFVRSEEHTSELQSLMRISYAVFCLKKKKKNTTYTQTIMTTKLNQEQ